MYSYAASTLVTLSILLIAGVSSTVTPPSGCTYSNGIYSCDYRFASPITLPEFDPQPQRLIIYNVDGAMDSTALVEWSLMNTTKFDDNYDAELEIICVQGGGELHLNGTVFEHMDFWQTVQITNCEIPEIPANAFTNFGNLNYFGIHGGSVSSVATDALAGMTVRRDPRSVAPKGELSIQDVDFPGGLFPTGFLTPQSSVSTLVLHRAGLNTVPVDLITHMVNLTTLSLDNNGFTALPSGLFNGLTAITTLNAAGINWDCGCGTLWWVDYVANNDMRVTSEMLCASPLSYYGQKATQYYNNACAGGLICDEGSLPAVNLANVTCLTYLQIAIYTFAVVSFLGFCILFGCWIHTRRQVNRMGGGGPTPRGPRRRPSGGNRIAGQPGRPAPPGIKAGWH